MCPSLVVSSLQFREQLRNISTKIMVEIRKSSTYLSKVHVSYHVSYKKKLARLKCNKNVWFCQFSKLSKIRSLMM